MISEQPFNKMDEEDPEASPAKCWLYERPSPMVQWEIRFWIRFLFCTLLFVAICMVLIMFDHDMVQYSANVKLYHLEDRIAAIERSLDQ